MEQIKNLLPQQLETMQQIDLSKKENKLSLICQDSKVIDLKYSSKRFGKMSPQEIKVSSYSVLVKISAITGWTIPASDLMMDILVEQFEKKMQEGYANVNEHEVEYAFRNKGVEVKDWGKAMNLALIDEVMIPYLENRFDLSRMEESLKKTIMIEEKTELTTEEKTEWVKEWKENNNRNFLLIPTVFYDYLNLSDYESNLEKAMIYCKKEIMMQNELQSIKDRKLSEFMRQEVDGFEGEYKGRILNMAKRISINNYFNKKDV